MTLHWELLSYGDERLHPTTMGRRRRWRRVKIGNKRSFRASPYFSPLSVNMFCVVRVLSLTTVAPSECAPGLRGPCMYLYIFWAQGATARARAIANCSIVNSKPELVCLLPRGPFRAQSCTRLQHGLHTGANARATQLMPTA